MKKLTIKINHVDKIEGHAGFVGDIINGDVAKAKFEVQIGIRLFERILLGRNFEDAAIITARVCGVCPVVHYLTALKAIEDALGIKLKKEIIILRKLLMLGQIIQSHSLHTYFMSLGDFFGLKNNLDLAKKFPKWTNDALAVRDFGNELIFAIGRRSIHPVALRVGGFRREPDIKKLQKLSQEIDEIITCAKNLSLFFSKLKYPKFFRQTEFIALTQPKEYAIYDGQLISSGGLRVAARNFEKMIYESQVDEVNRIKGKDNQTFMAGALARININHKKLNSSAKSILKKSKITLPSYNTFYNIFAQTVEIVHCLEEAKKLFAGCLTLFAVAKKNRQDNFLEKFNTKYKIKAGKGFAQIEAPRGTLYHTYQIDKNGKITWANIITPTAIFINNLEEDLKIYLPNLKKLSSAERERKIKMLIRAYDPCITCSVH
ncbi:MAG: Ni/Fe hydrogenase subunit alpha [Patescibacteria group bacterium]